MTALHRFAAAMPKAELHVHIEGTLEPELLMALARRNRVDVPYGSVEEVRGAYNFSRLQDFLDIYYRGMAVLRTRRDFFDLTWAYLTKIHGQNVVHSELFFDPQGHTARGVAFDDVVDGITQALSRGRRELGISSRLIMCILRHLPQRDAEETLTRALARREHIFGIGLDSTEVGNPPEKFARVFATARAAGLVAVAHAGEEGPADYVAGALDHLKVARIDHGNAALDDPALVCRLAAAGTALTVCPLSNLRLGVIDNMAGHPIRRMLEAGLRATVNSDDPAYFGGYMTENFHALIDALDLTRDEIVTLGRNAFLGSFMEEVEKARALERFDGFVQSH